ncbi:tumor necrosis factor receptor superfamily member 26-like [Myotis daubentonii]|uniref:tumor necrosis factor receptor superfamily member 26-like n=1 Tax=Myotis daubentonii TaxID=98922 RepID=UPI0028738854|nr:tumor necrosis factor receptor superfamily member 26-like [Myotis daubentonii]
MGQALRCCPCPPDSFLAHPSRAQSCSPCTQCREDQEMVSDCTPTQDRRCQCKTGEFYCDSEHCLEGCYRCTSCPGATLLTCTPTRDTMCAPAAQPEPGPPAGSLSVSALAVSVVCIGIVIIGIAIAIGIPIAIPWWRRRGKRRRALRTGEQQRGRGPGRFLTGVFHLKYSCAHFLIHF